MKKIKRKKMGVEEKREIDGKMIIRKIRSGGLFNKRI